ncbi:hypothetical protein BDV12DRAFT_207226 [Aspergillus spectabilis]
MSFSSINSQAASFPDASSGAWNGSYATFQFTDNIDKGPAEPDSDATVENTLEPIAVIGMAVKFPQDASDVEGFWQMLLKGKSAMTDIPKNRFNLDGYYHPTKAHFGTTTVRGGNFVKDDLDNFDAGFFSISPLEAASLDPQQRWLLETTYHALENAGLTLDDVMGTDTSVHVGSFLQEHTSLMQQDPELPSRYKVTGTMTSLLANRLSWFFNWKGASITLDTACSSTLHSLHLSCQGLRSRESIMGIVAGSNILYNPHNLCSMAEQGVLSPDSVCYAFDHRANGYVRGEGVAVLVLKPLELALRDGDTIRALVRSTAVNQDGRTDGGIMQPSSEAQSQLIRTTYRKAGLDMAYTRYVEAHGAGTPLGDLAEATALKNAFSNIKRDDPLIIGAVKTNIGHLEAVSALAGLVKAILILERKLIPPNVNFEKQSPRIKLKSGFHFPSKAIPWPAAGLRQASVNSFGLGGSNGHAVINDAYHYLKTQKLSLGRITTTRERDSTSQKNAAGSDDTETFNNRGSGLTQSRPILFVWSTRDPGGLSRLVKIYQDYLSKDVECQSDNRFLKKLAYTLSSKRSHLKWRAFAIADKSSDLCLRIADFPKNSQRSEAREPVFVFTGQGAQWYAMGRELNIYEVILADLDNDMWSVQTELHREQSDSRVSNTALSQLLTVVLQVALVNLLRSWNVYPSAVIGHSSGEIAAAYCSGILSFESVIKLAFYRGIALSEAGNVDEVPCGMLAVGASFCSTIEYLNQALGPSCKLSIACINSPRNVTVAGPTVQITTLEGFLHVNDIFTKRLNVKVSYHTPWLNNAACRYKDLLQGELKPGRGLTERQVMVSSVTGMVPGEGELEQPEYWAEGLVKRVNFSAAVSNLCSSGLTQIHRPSGSDTKFDCWLEIGPHSTLRRSLREIIQEIRPEWPFNYENLIRRDDSALNTTLEAMGRLHCLGVSVDLTSINNPNGESYPMLTDLPPYPFDHTQRYWHESRLSSNTRFRRFPRHELVGSSVPDWNRFEAKWRNYLSLTDHPWLGGHAVNGIDVCPAAGVLVMAIEAMQQVLDTTAGIARYKFRDIILRKALSVPGGVQLVETEFHMRASQDGRGNLSPWRQFSLNMFDSGEWVECCRGYISVEFDDPTEFCWHQDLEESNGSIHKRFQSCNTSLDTRRLYRLLDTSGLAYGPMFQGLQNVRYDGAGKATATVDLYSWKKASSRANLAPSAIHPATLDATMQLVIPAVTNGFLTQARTLVPTRIDAFWISASLDRSEKPRLQVFTDTENMGSNRVKASLVAMHESGIKCIEMSIVATEVAAGSMGLPHQRPDKPLCYHFESKPDLQSLSGLDITQWCLTDSRLYLCDQETMGKINYLCVLALTRLCDDASTVDTCPETSHLSRYLEWARLRLSEHNATELEGLSEPPPNFATLLEEVRLSGAEGNLVAQVASNLPRFFTGEVTAVELLLKDDAIESMYTHGLGIPSIFDQVAHFIDTLAFKNPAMRILEVGAGTGSATACVLDALVSPRGQRSNILRFSEYSFTDISPLFLDQAQRKLSNLVERAPISFSIFDLEKSPLEQGFTAEAYDLVIAFSVIHATSSIHQSLAHCRNVLKPGGKIILIEFTGANLMQLEFVFGLFPGWWLATEEHRRTTPLMTESYWDSYLKCAGFSGIDVALHPKSTPESQDHALSAIISTALEETLQPPQQKKLVIFVNRRSDSQLTLAAHVHKAYHSRRLCEVAELCEFTAIDVQPADYLFLVEVEDPLLYGDSDENFLALQRVFSIAQSILWVANGAEHNPFTSLIDGFHRAYQAERDNLTFVTFHLDNGTIGPSTAGNIMNVLDSLYGQPSEAGEDSYTEREGILHIYRAVQSNAVNESIEQATHKKEEICTLGRVDDRALKLDFKNPGLLNTFRFVEDLVLQRPLANDEVEIAIQYSGINFRDLLAALGHIDSTAFGLEGAGVVRRAGVESGFVPGDRAFGLFRGTLQTFSRCDTRLARRIPESLDMPTAAALPIIFCTAYHALVNLAKLQSGETVLIHSGAGGLGQAALQIARILGAEVFVTVGTEAKRDFLLGELRIPHSHIFSGRSTRFAEQIKSITGGRGVDVVLNSMSGEGLRGSYECLAPFGRFIDTTKRNDETSILPPVSLVHDTAFFTIDLINIVYNKPQLASDLLDAVVDLAVKSQISAPSPLQVYGASQIEDALRLMQSGRSTGKIVIEFRKDHRVPTLLRGLPTSILESNVSYLISGGMGGIGRAIARWMVSRGARYLILLSRRPKTDDNSIQFLEEMKLEGVTVAALACNICDHESLKAVLNGLRTTMPPVKGCVQAAMEVKNGRFDEMLKSDFDTALRPKVMGSWNLHTLLPRDLDFFILCASISGVTPSFGQTNYAAGNTFQDALARYRVYRGEKAVSIDMGMFVDAGFVANHAGLADQLQARGSVPLHMEDLLRLLEYYCRSTTPLLPRDETHAILGLFPSSQFRKLDMEEPYWYHRPLFSCLRCSKLSDSDPQLLTTALEPRALTLDIVSILHTSKTMEDAVGYITRGLVEKLAKVLVMNPGDIEINKPVHTHGVDSLVAMELREWFGNVLRAHISVFEIQSNLPIKSLACTVARRSEIVRNALGEEGATVPST